MTLNAFFVVRWTDTRLVIDQDRIDEILGPEAERAEEPEWIPVRLNLTDSILINRSIFPTGGCELHQGVLASGRRDP